MSFFTCAHFVSNQNPLIFPFNTTLVTKLLPYIKQTILQLLLLLSSSLSYTKCYKFIVKNLSLSLKYLDRNDKMKNI